MRRRELLAGAGSVALLGAGGAVAVGGLPSIGDGSPEDGGADSPPRRDPITVETLDAPGSEAGEVEIPAAGTPAFVDFFATWCDPCIEQMPALAAANERIGDDVLFVSVTTENVGGSVSESTVVDWWEAHDGAWTLGVDPRAELAARYLDRGIPYGVAIDAEGTVRWSDAGVKTADELVAGIERATE